MGTIINLLKQRSENWRIIVSISLMQVNSIFLFYSASDSSYQHSNQPAVPIKTLGSSFAEIII